MNVYRLAYVLTALILLPISLGVGVRYFFGFTPVGYFMLGVASTFTFFYSRNILSNIP